MGVYIKGMEMPSKKNGALLIIYPDGECAFEDGKTYRAVPVPPHGRLIDADALDSSATDYSGNHLVYLVDIDDAPTIIPADKEEQT